MTQKQSVTSTFQMKSLKIVSNIQDIDKIQRKIKKNLCRFTIKILFVARENFFKFDKFLARMVTKVHP